MRLTDDGDSWAPTWSPRGDQIAYLHVAGQVIDLQMAQLEGSGPNWTMKDADRPHDRAGLDGVSRPDWFVPASDIPTRPRLHGRTGRVARRRRDLVPRAARRAHRGDGHGPVRRHRPGPRRRCPPGFPADARRRRAVRAADRRGDASRTPPRSSPTSRSSRRTGRAGIAALERLRALVPADVPFVADAKRGDIGSTAARQAVALFDALGADAVTVNPYLGEEAIAPLLERADRFAYVLCRTSNPGAGELQGLDVAADAASGAPAEPLWARVARRAATWGPGGTVGLVVGATAPAELARDPRASRPASPSSCRASAPRAARSSRCSRTAPRRRAPAGGRPAAACSSTSRGGSRGRRSSLGRRPPGVARPLRASGADPGERLAAAAAEWAERLAVLP